jgi:hypothetical protein
MPGWGDEIDLVSSLKAVVTFLLEQRKKDLLDNKAGVTGVSRRQALTFTVRTTSCLCRVCWL